jgi:Transposase
VRIFTPALDIGSHINAAAQARLEAEAERTLEAVACSRLILIEASPSTYPGGMLALGETRRAGDLRRCYTTQHQFYGGIDLHARRLSVCMLKQDGEIVTHGNLKTDPEALLKVIAPYRADRVIAVECVFTWSWLADLCAREGLPFVLGHALYMQAMHGGQAKHDRLDADTIAVLLRGGMLPQAYAYPAARRATREALYQVVLVPLANAVQVG